MRKERRYFCEVDRILDGDTVEVTVDLPMSYSKWPEQYEKGAEGCDCPVHIGFGVFVEDPTVECIDLKFKIRMFGINAPEVRGPEKADGINSTIALRQMIDNKNVILQTFIGSRRDNDLRGKYGRPLGVLWVDDVNINEKMVEDGHAAQSRMSLYDFEIREDDF